MENEENRIVEDRHLRDYLGDAVYARYDGFGIWLAANHHENELIYIEPHVLEALNYFYKRMKDGKTGK